VFKEKGRAMVTSRSLNVLKDSHKRAAGMHPVALLPQKISSAVWLSALLRIIDDVLHWYLALGQPQPHCWGLLFVLPCLQNRHNSSWMPLLLFMVGYWPQRLQWIIGVPRPEPTLPPLCLWAVFWGSPAHRNSGNDGSYRSWPGSCRIQPEHVRRAGLVL